jgi:hypothetical protein
MLQIIQVNLFTNENLLNLLGCPQDKEMKKIPKTLPLLKFMATGH